jgi:xanthine dehydrogenase accessory factor
MGTLCDVDPLLGLERALKRGRRAALVTVTKLDGEPPSRIGLSLAVTENGTTYGTLGCDGFDRAGATDARRAIERGEPFAARYAWDETSHIDVSVQPYRPGQAIGPPAEGPELLIVGTGPVARALERLAEPLGFGARVAADAEAVRTARPGKNTFVVVCGHDEEFSQPALRTLLHSDAPYLGMMGSRRHTGHLLDDLRAAGFPEERITRVHTPIGLDLGAETPEEIALSAIAQIVAVRRGGSARPLDSR